MPTPAEKAALARLRGRIDRIDADLVELIVERHDLAGEVARLKRSTGTERYIPWREKEILRRISALNAGRLPFESLAGIFRDILGVCRQSAEPLVVAYPGPPGSIAHAAARSQFGASTVMEPADGIGDVMERVAQGRAGYGLLPLDTSAEGIGVHALEYFLESNLTITAEFYWRLELVLAGKGRRRKNRQRLFAQEMLIALHRPWIAAAHPSLEIVPAPSVAWAARLASEDPRSCAICPRFTAETYGLDELGAAPGPALQKELRFLTAGRSMPDHTRSDKTTIAFSLVDRVGVLEEALQVFKKRHVNLSLLESYFPSKTLPTVTFFADFAGHATDATVQRLLEDLRKLTSFVKVLGSYPVFRSE